MESLSRSLNFELSPAHDLHLDAYAQQMLEGSKLTASPTIATASSAHTAVTVSSPSSEFLQKLGASLINSIQLQQLRTQLKGAASPAAHTAMDMEFAPNHVVIDSSSFDGPMDEYQKQLEYDKFMNEIWIGIVLTLILISMVFCICSCFLYHQFKTWKRNYRSTIVQSQTLDIEAVKLHPDLEDPVPEYTLVSGLPSYEAALELLNKRAPNTCALLVYPSALSVFNERPPQQQPTPDEQQPQPQQQLHQVSESTTPLLTIRPGNNSRNHNHNNNSANNHDYAELHATAAPPAAATTTTTTQSPPSYISLTVDEKKPKSYGNSTKKSKGDKC